MEFPTNSDLAIRSMFCERSQEAIEVLQDLARDLTQSAIRHVTGTMPSDYCLFAKKSVKAKVGTLMGIRAHLNVFVHQDNVLSIALQELRQRNVLKAEIYVGKCEITPSAEPAYHMNINPFIVLIESMYQDAEQLLTSAKKPA